MKYPLLALTLLASAPLTAGQSQYNNNSNDENYECCEQECCPPRKCIDCECYTPAYYDMECDWGFFAYGDFLYWYARETNLSYAAVARSDIFHPDEAQLVSTLSSVQDFEVNWKPGFRIGIGFNSSCDGWDTTLNWTYFRSSRSDTTSRPNWTDAANPPELLLNPWIAAPSLRGDEQFIWSKIAADWSLRFNQVDLELGRKYWLSKCFNLRPYAGLRGAWSKIKFKTTSTIDTIVNDTVPAVGLDQIEISNKIWGIGIKVGIQPNWHLCNSFVLYSDLSASLLWGNLKSSHKENSTYTYYRTLGADPLTSAPQFSRNFYQMQSSIDLGIGLRWEEFWCCHRYRTALDLGWEHHIWLNYDHRIQLNGMYEGAAISRADPSLDALNIFSSYKDINSDLMMGGFVLRLRLDF